MTSLTNFIATEWLTITFGLIAIAMTVWGVRKSQRTTRVSYLLVTGSVLGRNSLGLPPKVTIAYNDEPVGDVARTSIAVWNSGNSTISGQQIIADHPPLIHFKGCGTILNAKLVHASRTTSKVRVGSSTTNSDESTLRFFFDYLEPDEGAVFEILHTPFNNVYLECPLRGMKTPPKKLTGMRTEYARRVDEMDRVLVPFVPSWAKALIGKSTLIVASSVFVFAGVYLIVPDSVQTSASQFLGASAIQFEGVSDIVWSIGEVMVGIMVLIFGIGFLGATMSLSRKAPSDLDRHVF